MELSIMLGFGLVSALLFLYLSDKDRKKRVIELKNSRADVTRLKKTLLQCRIDFDQYKKDNPAAAE